MIYAYPPHIDDIHQRLSLLEKEIKSLIKDIYEIHEKMGFLDATIHENKIKSEEVSLELSKILKEKQITDTERLDFLLKNEFISVSGKQPSGDYIIFDQSNGLEKISTGKTEREAIDAAMRAKDGK